MAILSILFNVLWKTCFTEKHGDLCTFPKFKFSLDTFLKKKKIDSSIKLIRNPDDRGKVLNIHISLALLDAKFSIQKILLHHNLGGNCN